MSTEYTNKLIITGSPDSIRSFVRKNKEAWDESRPTADEHLYQKGLCLSALYPEPDGNNTSENWRDWRYENWGFKWAHTLEYEIFDNRISITLEVANGTIERLIDKVSEIFPDLTFNLKWQMGGGGESGARIVKNGQLQKRNPYYDNGGSRSYLIVTGDAAMLTAFETQFKSSADFIEGETHPVRRYSFGNFIPTIEGRRSIAVVRKKSEINTISRHNRPGYNNYEDLMGYRPDEPEVAAFIMMEQDIREKCKSSILYEIGLRNGIPEPALIVVSRQYPALTISIKHRAKLCYSESAWEQDFENEPAYAEVLTAANGEIIEKLHIKNDGGNRRQFREFLKNQMLEKYSICPQCHMPLTEWEAESDCPNCGSNSISIYPNCGDKATAQRAEKITGKEESTKPQTVVSKSKAAVRPTVNCTIKFAGIDWRVLAVENNKALLLSRKILEKRSYNKEPKDVTWETCSLREYLNGDFYNRLGKKAKAAVAETINTTSNNQWYCTNGNTTTDKIFLLSLDEVALYFGDSGALEKKKSKNINYYYVKDNKFKHIDKPDASEWCSFGDQYNSARIAYNKAGMAQRWWLRSPGDDGNHATYIFNNGCVDVGGLSVTVENGVRPALWINL